MAGDFERGGSRLYARVAREYADHPVVLEIGREHKPRWEVPLRLFGAIRYLELAGEVDEPWGRVSAVLDGHRAWIARFVAEQPVQTNEVQRSWGLLPGFLSVAEGRPLALLELGPSAGLNLYWDRYRYRYGEATWGPRGAPLELAGEAHGGPPSALFAQEVEVRGRVGIDRSPVDVTTEHGARLLEAFVWPDHTERLERLRCAITAVRPDPPKLVRGDYVELLPRFLKERDPDVLTVVFHSASTSYLPRSGRAAVAEAIEAAGASGPLAWVSYEFDEETGAGYERFMLDVRVWPGGQPRRLARLDGHANRLEWIAE